MVEQLSQALGEANEKLESKAMEIESKERIETLKIQADLTKTAWTSENVQTVAALMQEVQMLNERLLMLGINQPIETEMQENLQPQEVESGL
jgi:hypothetical protein